MLRWLKRQIKEYFYFVVWFFTGKQPYQVDQFFKARARYSADDIYDSIIAKLEKIDRNEPCEVITSFENISILMKAGLILADGHTTKMWLRIKSPTEPGASGTKIASSGIRIAGSSCHGNNYANVVFSEVSSGLEKS